MADGDALEAAQAELTRTVMGREGVVGTAIGLHAGQPCIKVYVTGREVDHGAPPEVNGVPVVIEVTGRIGRL